MRKIFKIALKHPGLRLLAFALAWLATSAGLAVAADIENVEIGLHQSRLVATTQPVAQFIVTNSNIASVVKHDDYTVSVVGHSIGMTDIRLLNNGQTVKQLTVSVLPNVPAIQRFIGKIFPYEEIGVEQINGTIALTGFVSSAETAAQIQQLVESYLSDGQTERRIKVVNLLKLYSGQQVMLVVKIGEIRKEAKNEIGLGMHGSMSLPSRLLGALEQRGAFRVLAEPKLTAISGETATFLAGSEYPVPVAGQGGTPGIEYKPYGVNVKFTPEVISENRIRVNVASEVSEAEMPKGLKYLFKDGMPVFNTRKADTTVELASGESFMIAGLISNTQSLKGYDTLPGFNDIPLFRSLLSSTEFKNNETELVIAVTPHLVHPVTSDELRFPTDTWEPVSPADSLLQENLLKRSGLDRSAAPGPEGKFGFAE